MSNEHVRLSAESIFRDNTLVRLSISVWTAKREVPGDKDDKRRGSFVKLVDPKWLKEVNAVATRARSYIANKGERFILGNGTYLVPNDELEDALTELEEIRELFLDSVEDFVDSYDEALAESKDLLTPQEFKLCPSKSALPARFGFRYGRFTFALPTDAGSEEVQEWNDAISEWAGESYNQLVVRLYDFAQHAEEILGNTKRKLFASVLGNVVSTCELYRSKMDMLGARNKDFTSLVGKIEESFREMDIATLRDDDDKRLDAAVTVKSWADKIKPFLPSGDNIIL